MTCSPEMGLTLSGPKAIAPCQTVRMLTVVVVAMSKPDPDTRALRSELSLARSAALYADKLILLSPYAHLVQQLAHEQVELADPKSVLEAMRTQRPDLYQALHAEADPQALYRALIASVQMQAVVPAVAANVEELGRAAGMGFLTQRPVIVDADPDALLNSMTDALFQLLLDPTVHAVCDARAATIMRYSARRGDGRLTASIAKRNREAELGAGLIARLPAFPQAPINELLDVKADLQEPLTRYRAAVARLEKDMPQDVGSAEIDADIQAAWRAHVAPALDELQDILTEHSFVRSLARSAGSSARDLVLAGSALSLATSNISHIAASASAAAGAVGAAAQLVASATLARATKHHEARRGDFFYLQELSRRISAST